MKIKKLALLTVFSLLLAGCNGKTTTNQTQKTANPAATKILINELALKDRPFTVLVPHNSGKIFTFYTQNADKANSATVDLEYQSGDLLKGARTTLETPIANPNVKAIVLGSCSTGGKCTFDTDLKSGTMKFKLTFPGEQVTHLLKGDFTFVTGQTNLPDGKVIFEPAKTKTKSVDSYILTNSFGLPKPIDKDIALYPIVISSTGEKNIVGTLTVNQSGVTSAMIYDGTTYQTLKYTESNGSLTFKIDQKPWSQSATITRDDIKGTQEQTTLYLVGPIVLVK